MSGKTACIADEWRDVIIKSSVLTSEINAADAEASERIRMHYASIINLRGNSDSNRLDDA